MNFVLQQSSVYSAVQTARVFPSRVLKFWRILLLVIGFGAFGVAHAIPGLAFVTRNALSVESLLLSDTQWLGIAFIALPFAFSIVFFEIFLSFSVQRPPISNVDNVAEYLSFEAAVTFVDAESIAKSQGESNISTSSLLLALANDKKAAPILSRLGIISEDFEKVLTETSKTERSAAQQIMNIGASLSPSDDLLEAIAGTFAAMRRHKGERISLADLFVALAEINKTFQQFLIDQDLDKKDLDNLAIWYEAEERHYRRRKHFWTRENLVRTPPIGAGWSYGYTPLLDHFGTNVTRRFKEGREEITLIGRDAVIEQIEEILARAGENNVLLVGETGVGKNTTILGFAQMIARGTTLPALHYKQIFKLNVPLLASSSESPAQIRQTIINLLDEAAKAGNIVLIMEDLHNIVSGEGEISGAELMEIFIPYIGSNAIQVISTTDPLSYHRTISPRGEVLDIFEKIEVDEPSIAETMQITHQIIPELELRTGMFITYAAIKTTVEGADKYIQTVPFPEKAINLLTEVVSFAQARGKRVVRIDDVNSVITRKTDIPTGAIGAQEKEKLIHLENVMHQDVIGQNEAVSAVAQTLRRLRAGLTTGERPAGVFLFVGPTGVGKTLTAKVLAKHYFGSDDRMIRFDMSEYQNPDSVGRFLGSLQLNQPGQLITAMRDDPFAVVLLDEFEKANHDILNLFLQVFDEGHITDVFGRKVSFEQSIIIATSNAAAPTIVDMINEGIDPSQQKEQLMRLLINDNHFAPELINRFDEVVIFHPLSREDIRKIAELMLEKLVLNLKDQGYVFDPTQELIDYVASIGFDPQFGARPMRRALQDTVEAVIATKILSEEIKKGTSFSVNPDELKHD